MEKGFFLVVKVKRKREAKIKAFVMRKIDLKNESLNL